MEQRTSKIVLVGFMGTGKSTVSRLLAEQLGWSRYDSDEVIEETEGTISTLFETLGEAGFREIESRVLVSLLEAEESSIIATGGGCVLMEQNRETMLKHGFVVALTADAEHIIERVKSDTARPLLQGDIAANVHRIMEQRKNAYDFAHLRLDTTSLTPQEAADMIMRALQEK
ncbi:shikimate kinase [Paenibacillus glycanilyticus]|uniref:shikimate kinase n=1 Tax=Paenibacillus glycanilyticus TaxID=126569 RepID=UPI00203A7540|nr:shikimate kinase [Paenibacillus glycanilyticus]MCM3626364.1 shikimate kinase [Paenibacillus glycanilyticus]